MMKRVFFPLLCLVALAAAPPIYHLIVPIGAADSATIKIDLEGGDLAISSGAEQLIEGDLLYSKVGDKPKIQYHLNDTVAEVRLEGVGTENYWELQIANAIPIDFQISTRSGDQMIDFEGLQVRSLDIEVGKGNTAILCNGAHPSLRRLKAVHKKGNMAVRLPGFYPRLTELHIEGGETNMAVDLNGSLPHLKAATIKTTLGNATIDLTGPWLADVAVDILSQEGNLEIDVPDSVGVVVFVSAAKTQAPGMKQMKVDDRDAWVNSSYQKTSVTLTVDVRTKSGSVALQ